jgi:hypothetical protein
VTLRGWANLGVRSESARRARGGPIWGCEGADSGVQVGRLGGRSGPIEGQRWADLGVRSPMGAASNYPNYSNYFTYLKSSAVVRLTPHRLPELLTIP